jgi:hypothetical protein
LTATSSTTTNAPAICPLSAGGGAEPCIDARGRKALAATAAGLFTA